ALADHDRASDRRPLRRHERRGGTRDPRRRRTAEPARRADDARRRPPSSGAGCMTDVWSERAEAYRESEAHRQGRDLELFAAWAAGKTVLDVATGGGHVATRIRAAGCKVVTSDSAPGMQPDVICRAEDLPFADSSFDVVTCRVAAHHFEDPAAAVRELARVSADLVLVADNLYLGEAGEEADRLRDPTHVRNYSEDDIGRAHV